MRPGVRDFLVRLRALTGPILAVLWGAGMSVHPVLSKTPGEVHCYHLVCHRVLTKEETNRLVGSTRILITSYYDDPRLDGFNTGQLTSSGEKFDANNTGRVASSIFPDGTELLVWNPLNGRAADVRVNDFGPFRSNRTLDLTAALAKHLDITRKGVIGLQVTVIAPPPSDEPSYRKFRTYAETKGYLGMYDEEALGALAKRLTAETLTHSARADPPEAADVPLPLRKPSVRFEPRDTIPHPALEELSEARPDVLVLSRPHIDMASLPSPALLPLTEVPSALVVAIEPPKDWRSDHFKTERLKFTTDTSNVRLGTLPKAPPLIVLCFLVAAQVLGMTVIFIQRRRRAGTILMRVEQEGTADRRWHQADGAATICEVSTETPRASIIGRDLRIIGSLVTCNEVVLEGSVEGDCVCGSLLIKPAGKLLGDVIAEEVLVAGSTKGRLMAKTVSVGGKAVVTGQVDYCDLIVERGAALEAKVRRMPIDAWMTSGQKASANAGLSPKPSLSLATLGSRLLTFQP
jgi:rare lipoprotein A (peptidoglycan hydrolase)/cytoskeletal protein CcmA (bactofilin family)